MGPIRSNAIKRVAITTGSFPIQLKMAFVDVTVSLMNHMVCGTKYELWTSWLMGEDVDPTANPLIGGFGGEYRNRLRPVLLEARDCVKVIDI